MIKQKRKEKAGKWDVPLPKVKPISEDEIFKVVKTGKRQSMFSPNSLIYLIQHIGR
jgi:ribosome biogenesis protein NSA2